MTYNNSGNALLRVADLLQVLRDDGEDAGGKSHVKQTVRLGPVFLDLLQVLLELLERLILIILTGDVGAEFGELLQLVLGLLGRGLHVGFDSAQVLFAVHLGTGISDDSDIFGEELVSILHQKSAWLVYEQILGIFNLTKPKSAGYYQIVKLAQAVEDGQDKRARSYSLLFGKIARSTKDDNSRVLLQLNSSRHCDS